MSFSSGPRSGRPSPSHSYCKPLCVPCRAPPYAAQPKPPVSEFLAQLTTVACSLGQLYQPQLPLGWQTAEGRVSPNKLIHVGFPSREVVSTSCQAGAATLNKVGLSCNSCPSMAHCLLQVYQACFPFCLAQVADKAVQRYWAQLQALQNTCSLSAGLTDQETAILFPWSSGWRS